ncbi:serine--tRNA ligase, partial [Streptomyces anulatus]
MIDLRTLREDPDRLRASQRARGEDDSVVDTLLDLDERRRGALSRFETLRSEQKSIGKSVSRSSGEEKAALLDRAKDLATQVKSAETEAEKLAKELDELLYTVPNLVEAGAPSGGEDDYVVLEEV